MRCPEPDFHSAGVGATGFSSNSDIVEGRSSSPKLAEAVWKVGDLVVFGIPAQLPLLEQEIVAVDRRIDGVDDRQHVGAGTEAEGCAHIDHGRSARGGHEIVRVGELAVVVRVELAEASLRT